MLILKLMIVFHALPFSDSVLIGTFVVNDLTFVLKTLYDKAIAFVHIPKVIPDQIHVMILIVCKQKADVQENFDRNCVSPS